MKRTKITNTQQMLTAFLLIISICAVIGGYLLKEFIHPFLVFEAICLLIIGSISLLYYFTARKQDNPRPNYLKKYLINGTVFAAIPSDGGCDGCHFVGKDTCYKEWCGNGKYIHVLLG